MAKSLTPRREKEEADGDSWPWQCLSCGVTIYHDGTYCRDCSSPVSRNEPSRRFHASDGFLRWMRRESVPSLTLKVSGIAGIELTLTALWLEFLLRGTVALHHIAPGPV